MSNRKPQVFGKCGIPYCSDPDCTFDLEKAEISSAEWNKKYSSWCSVEGLHDMHICSGKGKPLNADGKEILFGKEYREATQEQCELLWKEKYRY